MVRTGRGKGRYHHQVHQLVVSTGGILQGVSPIEPTNYQRKEVTNVRTRMSSRKLAEYIIDVDSLPKEDPKPHDVALIGIIQKILEHSDKVAQDHGSTLADAMMSGGLDSLMGSTMICEEDNEFYYFLHRIVHPLLGTTFCKEITTRKVFETIDNDTGVRVIEEKNWMLGSDN